MTGDAWRGLVRGRPIGGPAVEDAHDAPAGAMHEPSRGVPQSPAQRLGFGDGERAGQAEQLEPAHQGIGEAHDTEPGPDGFDVDEREPMSAAIRGCRSTDIHVRTRRVRDCRIRRPRLQGERRRYS